VINAESEKARKTPAGAMSCVCPTRRSGSAIQGGAVVVKKPGALGRLYERLVLSLLAIIVTFVSKKTLNIL